MIGARVLVLILGQMCGLAASAQDAVVDRTAAAIGEARVLATGKLPRAVAVGDFNDDGRPDVAVSNQGSNDITVRLNNTATGANQPSFSEATSLAGGFAPSAVATADINRDGKADLVAANVGSDDVTVHLNDTARGAGTPTFGKATHFAVGASPIAIAVGDFNRDGRPDVAVANQAANTVTLRMNETASGARQPSFANGANIPAGNVPVALAAGDFNADGLPDLAALNADGQSIVILVNATPAGATQPTFGDRLEYPAGMLPLGLALADLNADRKLDLVVADHGGGTLAVRMNRTTSAVPAFGDNIELPAAEVASHVAVADVNADGRPDLILAGAIAGRVTVRLNNTRAGASVPAFTSGAELGAGLSIRALATADFNRDGRTDIAAGDQRTDQLLVWPNTFESGAPTSADFAAGRAPVALAAGDFNGDGKPDLAVASREDRGVSVLINRTQAGADGPAFAERIVVAVPSPQVDIAAADVNHDGRLDLVTANLSGASVLLNDTAKTGGTPSFAPARSYGTLGSSRSLALGDFDGDGILDIGVATHTVELLINATPKGAHDAAFLEKHFVPVFNRPEQFAAADLNGDRLHDIVTWNGAEVVVKINQTPRNTRPPLFIKGPREDIVYDGQYTDGWFGGGLAVGDVEGNGTPDIVVTTNDTTVTALAGPRFAEKIGGYRSLGPIGALALGDLDCDGKQDLIVAQHGMGSSNLAVRRGADGAALFGEGTTLLVGGRPVDIAIADFDVDGRPDLAVVNDTGTGITVWLNRLEGSAGCQAGRAPAQQAAGKMTPITAADVRSGTTPGADHKAGPAQTRRLIVAILLIVALGTLALVCRFRGANAGR